jgi:hypothetical protein
LKELKWLKGKVEGSEKVEGVERVLINPTS